MDLTSELNVTTHGGEGDRWQATEDDGTRHADEYLLSTRHAGVGIRPGTDDARGHREAPPPTSTRLRIELGDLQGADHLIARRIEQATLVHREESHQTQAGHASDDGN
jgi:hypothetical protein